MVRLAAGHGPALNDLMERHAPKLSTISPAVYRMRNDAADLAQETFVAFFQNRTKSTHE